MNVPIIGGTHCRGPYLDREANCPQAPSLMVRIADKERPICPSCSLLFRINLTEHQVKQLQAAMAHLAAAFNEIDRNSQEKENPDGQVH